MTTTQAGNSKLSPKSEAPAFKARLCAPLNAARVAVHYSCASLAAIADIDHQLVARAEKGVGSLNTLVAVMKVLDLEIAGLEQGSSLASRLCNQRETLSLSQGELATRAKLSMATVRSLETGAGTIQSLAKALAVLAPKAKIAKAKVGSWSSKPDSDRDSRFTPDDFMQKIYAAFGPVDLDPCAHELSPVQAKRRIVLQQGGDGLKEDWSGGLVFVNPPFSKLVVWLKRAHSQWKNGNVDTVLCLMPVRTDSVFFQDILSHDVALFLLKGRLKFTKPCGGVEGTKYSMMLLALGTSKMQQKAFAKMVEGFWVRR